MTDMVIELVEDPEEGGFTARVPDIPAYGEGETEDDAIADLREALTRYIQTFGLEDAKSRVIKPRIRPVVWDLTNLVRA